MGSVEYHLKELAIAMDKDDKRRVLPELLPSDEFILDIGCGIGQTLLALNCTDRTCFGLDVNEDAIRYGMEKYKGKIQFVLADAKSIPFPSDSFDLAYVRVSLLYTNIPAVVKEVRRVLREGGRFWTTVQTRQMTTAWLKEAVAARNVKRSIRQLYSLLNGYVLKHFGVVFPFVNGVYESWQDASAVRKLMVRAGFDADVKRVGMHTIVEGRLGRK